MVNDKLTVFSFAFRTKILIISLCCVLLNINTIKNEYALDDDPVITQNMYVHSGFGGIGKILSTDAYQAYFDLVGAKNPLSGGRYRPLSIVTFAIEDALFGNPMGEELLKAQDNLRKLQTSASSLKQFDEAAAQVKALNEQIIQENLALAPVRHMFQIFWFTLSMIILFVFLHRYLLPGFTDVAFAATLLFVFHPVHTEVVANLKSRDEIFSLMFILLSCICVFRYHKSRKTKDLVTFLLSSAAAFLSKEYAVLLPVIALVAICLTQNMTATKVMKSTWFLSLCGLLVFMLLVRMGITGSGKKSGTPDILNDPFLLATVQEEIATKIALLNEYLKLLVFPAKLSSDYSYRHFPYYTFADWQVWLSLLTWTAIVWVTIKLWRMKHILSFALIFFLAFFMLINNVLFDIGATMGERLIYMSSFGFCVILAWGMIQLGQRFNMQDKKAIMITTALLAAFIAPYGFKTIARNADWKNNFTLFTRDVRYVTNSALANGNAGAEYYNRGYLQLKAKNPKTHADSLLFRQDADTAILFLSKAVQIHNKYVNAYINRGLCYMATGQTDSAVSDWKQAALNFNGRHAKLAEHARQILDIGRKLGVEKKYDMAVRFLRDASVIDASNADIWDNLGGAEFMLGNFNEANYAFNQALLYNPNLSGAKQGASASRNFQLLETKCKTDSTNVNVWIEAADAYKQAGFKGRLKYAYTKILELDPGNITAVNGLQNISLQGSE